MLGEIDKDFYCSANKDCYKRSWTGDKDILCKQLRCGCYHRKHPTEEEYKLEYGAAAPEGIAVYARCCNVFVRTRYNADGSFTNFYKFTEWRAMSYADYKEWRDSYDECCRDMFEAVIACAPFECPDNDEAVYEQTVWTYSGARQEKSDRKKSESSGD